MCTCYRKSMIGIEASLIQVTVAVSSYGCTQSQWQELGQDPGLQAVAGAFAVSMHFVAAETNCEYVHDIGSQWQKSGLLAYRCTAAEANFGYAW